MIRFLPFAWLLFIPVSAVFTLIIAYPSVDVLDVSMLAPKLPGLLNTALLQGSFAALFALFSRVTTRRLVFYLGWIQFGAQILSTGFASYFYYIRHLARTTDRALISGEILFVSGSITVLLTISILAFFAAVMVALTDARKNFNIQVFE